MQHLAQLETTGVPLRKPEIVLIAAAMSRLPVNDRAANLELEVAKYPNTRPRTADNTD